jgi:hypothetical protein
MGEMLFLCSCTEDSLCLDSSRSHHQQLVALDGGTIRSQQTTATAVIEKIEPMS